MGVGIEDISTTITIRILSLKSLEDRNKLVQDINNLVQTVSKKYYISTEDWWVESPRSNEC